MSHGRHGGGRKKVTKSGKLWQGGARRHSQFGAARRARVEELVQEEWSPEQVAGYLRCHGELAISRETSCRPIWADGKAGGTLHAHLRGPCQNCRKRHGRYDRRCRLGGKRRIGERPAVVDRRQQLGHGEIDTMMGQSLGESRDCIVTLVERQSGCVALGKQTRANLAAKPTAPSSPCCGGSFYFATPHHRWERGTHENNNGLIPTILPKGSSMTDLT